MKAFKTFFLIALLVSFTDTVIAQTSDEYFKTLCKRVQTQGEKPSQEQYNFYVDKMNQVFYNTKWKDEVLSIRQIIVKPADDPNNWYYFAMVKTKNCIKPFYFNYDSHDLNFNISMFHLAEGYLPDEFRKHIDELKSKLKYWEMHRDDQIAYLDKNYPIFKDSIHIFIQGLLVPEINNTCHADIDSFIVRFPDSLREAKRKEFWDDLINSDAYKAMYAGWYDFDRLDFDGYLGPDHEWSVDQCMSYVKGQCINTKDKIIAGSEDFILSKMYYLIKSKLPDLETKVRTDASYLKEKLKIANVDQIKFYGIYIDPSKPESFVDRFTGLFKQTIPMKEHLQNMKYYFVNYNFFFENK